MRQIIHYMLLLLVLGIFTDTRSQNIKYPYPVSYMNLHVEGKAVEMAYMDVSSPAPNGKTAVLFHGKNFNGYYWKEVIPFLNALGYRVIVPDQLGFGLSSKPDIHYSFHQMAVHTKQLLDSLNIHEAVVIGHSMGGMLAVRFTLLYPSVASRLILENPIGLEDYRTFVPYTPIDTLYRQELEATYASYKAYQKTYYPVWKPEYESLVAVQAKDIGRPEFPAVAWANALTYQMIYEQPVCYEFKRIQVKTLLLIGTSDRTIVGKAKLSPEMQARYGQYQLLGVQVQQQIPGSLLVELPGIGHIPHVQDPAAFKKAVTAFLND